MVSNHYSYCAEMDEKETQFYFGRVQTHTLKISLDCQGCVKKVKKLLKRIAGVYEVKIEAEQDKVTVSGNVDCSTLIKRLTKSGKHAEVLSLYSKNWLEDDTDLDCNLKPTDDYLHSGDGNANKWELDEYLGRNNTQTDKWGFENYLNYIGSKAQFDMGMEPVLSFPCHSDPVQFAGLKHAGFPNYPYQYTPWYNYPYPVMHKGMQGLYPMANMEANAQPFYRL